MTLDLAVSRAVMAARLIERAVHDHGPWAMRVEGITCPAVRWITGDRVIFRAHLPEVCFLDDEHFVDLLCNGEPVSTRLVDFSSGDLSITWTLALQDAPAPAYDV
jgi:hypothetical protein